MKTPLTKDTLKTHLLYNWYKYLGLGIILVGVISLITTTTRYIPPEDKRIDVLVTADFCSQGVVEDKVKEIASTIEFSPEVEQINVSSLLVTEDGSTEIVLASRIMLGAEIDIMFMPTHYFDAYVREGIFTTLDDITTRFPSLADVDLSSGMRTITTGDQIGETHLYGIPLTLLPNLVDEMSLYSADQDIFLCMFRNNKNEANVSLLFDAMIENGLKK